MRRLRAHLLLLLGLATWALAFPAGAAAGTGGYASHPWPGCGGGGFNSGSWDAAGRVYVPCGNPSSIGVYDTSARLVQSIHLDYWVTDVAPTRDGTYLYLATTDQPRRLVRTADGSYVADPTWAPLPYSIYGSPVTPRGRFVTTDAAGRVYLADGYWSPNNTHTVVVYEPNGTPVTRFGEWVKESWAPGDFYWALGGIAVSNDGATVYTTESGNNRIQTWTRQGDGSYLPTGRFGGSLANNADRGGFCDYNGWLGKFAAPYDVSLDQAGNVYVINTTCKQVLKFAPGPGALLANVDVRVAGGDYPRPHGFAVGADGTVYVGENQRVLRPAGGSVPADGGPPVRPAPPAPAPESEANDPAPTPPTPPAPQVTQDVTPPVTMLGATRTYRTRTGSIVRTTARCNELCRIELRAVQNRRLIGRRVIWIPRGVTRRIDVRLGRTVRAGGVAVRLSVRDAAGNTRLLGRSTRVLRAASRVR